MYVLFCTDIFTGKITVCKKQLRTPTRSIKTSTHDSSFNIIEQLRADGTPSTVDAHLYSPVQLIRAVVVD